jgi:hypothetical protein
MVDGSGRELRFARALDSGGWTQGAGDGQRRMGWEVAAGTLWFRESVSVARLAEQLNSILCFLE